MTRHKKRIIPSVSLGMIALTLALSGCSNGIEPGPLPQFDGWSVTGFDDNASVDLAWGISLPANPTDSLVRIDKIEFRVHNVRVNKILLGPGIGMVYATDVIGPSALFGPVHEWTGYDLPPHALPPKEMIVLIVTPMGPGGSISNVNLVYSSNGHTFVYQTHASFESGSQASQ